MFQEQIQRQNSIKDLCQGSKLTPINRPAFIYIPDYNLLYCRINKAGSTTWLEGILMGLVQKLGIDFSNSRLHPRLALREKYKVKSMEHWKQILENNPISFANVRHPFERPVK